MEEIGIVDAKTQFSELVDHVNKTGLPITVTNGGKPVAEIVPRSEASVAQMTREEAFAKVAQLWKTVDPMSKEEIKQAIAERRN